MSKKDPDSFLMILNLCTAFADLYIMAGIQLIVNSKFVIPTIKKNAYI